MAKRADLEKRVERLERVVGVLCLKELWTYRGDFKIGVAEKPYLEALENRLPEIVELAKKVCS